MNQFDGIFIWHIFHFLKVIFMENIQIVFREIDSFHLTIFFGMG